jgi:transposase InsO family protein
MRAEADTGHCIRVLRSDSGGEYISKELIQWLDGKGITCELTTPDTPQHNRVVRLSTSLGNLWF